MPKKGCLTLSKNYRTIALINHMGKVLMVILLSHLKAKTEEYIMSDEDAGFRKDNSTAQQILMLRLIGFKKFPLVLDLPIVWR